LIFEFSKNFSSFVSFSAMMASTAETNSCVLCPNPEPGYPCNVALCLTVAKDTILCPTCRECMVQIVAKLASMDRVEAATQTDQLEGERLSDVVPMHTSTPFEGEEVANFEGHAAHLASKLANISASVLEGEEGDVTIFETHGTRCAYKLAESASVLEGEEGDVTRMEITGTRWASQGARFSVHILAPGSAPVLVTLARVDDHSRFFVKLDGNNMERECRLASADRLFSKEAFQAAGRLFREHFAKEG